MEKYYNSTRVGVLDGFRFLLALWVFTAHYYGRIGGIYFFKLPNFLLETFNKPVYAVNGFMVITGFLMTYNYLLRSKKEPFESSTTHIKFWLRRFYRLYPVYILAVVVSFVFYVPLAEFTKANLIFFTGDSIVQGGVRYAFVDPGFDDLVAHILMIQGLFPQYYMSVLAVTWSLSLEAQFYLMFPAFFLFLFASSRKLKKWFLIFLVGFLAVSVVLPKVVNAALPSYQMQPFILPSVLLFVMPLFFIGMVSAAVKFGRIHLTYLLCTLAVTLPFQSKVTVGIVLLLLLFLFLDELRFAIPKWIFSILDFIRDILSSKPAVLAADLSYSFYLIHMMIISVGLQILIGTFPSLGPVKIAVLGYFFILMMSSAISYAIYRLVEKPLIAYGRSRINKIGANIHFPVQAVHSVSKV